MISCDLKEQVNYFYLVVFLFTMYCLFMIGCAIMLLEIIFFREMKGNNWLFLTNFFKEKSIPIIKVLGMQRVRKQNIGI